MKKYFHEEFYTQPSWLSYEGRINMSSNIHWKRRRYVEIILFFGKYPFLLPLCYRGIYFPIPLRVGCGTFFIQGLHVHVTYTILIRGFKCAREVNLSLLYSVLSHKKSKPQAVLIFQSGSQNGTKTWTWPTTWNQGKWLWVVSMEKKIEIWWRVCMKE